jgi:hypothetical protein
MSKDVIIVDGEKTVVREDTAKAYRGINWALISIFGFVLIAALVAIGLFLRAASSGNVENPQQVENSSRK